MGVLCDMSQQLMREMESRYANPMDLLRAKGAIASSAGFMVSLVSAGDPDDAVKIAKLREAAHEQGIVL
jgi:hypothetical protein